MLLPERERVRMINVRNLDIHYIKKAGSLGLLGSWMKVERGRWIEKAFF